MLRKALLSAARSLGTLSLTRYVTRDTPRVFMFHRFSQSPTANRTEAWELTRFINEVGQYCEFTTVSDLVVRLGAENSIERPLAAITVDDGYTDFHEVAFPVLKAQGVPATLYATVGFVDGLCWLWWDALAYLLDKLPEGTVNLDLGGRSFSAVTVQNQSRHDAWSRLANELLYDNDARASALIGLQQETGVVLPDRPPPEFAPLSWAQLRDLAAAGIEIGAHSFTHAHLPSLAPSRLKHEIHMAKCRLESELGGSVRTFAYPNGTDRDYSPAVEQAVRQAGFESALLAYPRRFCPGNMFQIGRWSVRSEDIHLQHIINGTSDLKLAWQNR